MSCWRTDWSVLSGEGMRWFGEDSVNFTNWEEQLSSSDLVRIDLCAALHSTTGKWEPVSCMQDVENGVICEAAQSKTFLPHKSYL